MREADLILVFSRGHVVERGSFAELVARNGVFADLVRTQLGHSAGEGGTQAFTGSSTAH